MTTDRRIQALRARLAPRTPAQLARALAILRDVQRSGGSDVWDHLHSHGHRNAVVRSCCARGELIEDPAYRYTLTDAGRSVLQEGKDA